jgi:hypothetical protein
MPRSVASGTLCTKDSLQEENTGSLSGNNLNLCREEPGSYHCSLETNLLVRQEISVCFNGG